MARAQNYVGTPDVVASVDDGVTGTIQVTADNAGPSWFGTDDPAGMVQVIGSSLYHIASLPSFQEATLHLKVSPGVSLHTFTPGD